MLDAVVLAPLTIAGVLALSGVAKQRDLGSTRSAMILLRLPKFLHEPWAAKSLAPGELVLAAALLLAPATVPAVVVAGAVFALMLTYWILIARALTFDPRPTCGCFGRIGQNQVTPRTLVRNTVLVAVSGLWLAATIRGASTPGILRDLTSAGWAWIAGTLVAGAILWLIAVPARVVHKHVPAPRPEQPPAEEELDYIRRPIPLATLLNRQGEVRTLTELTQDQAVLLVFINCFCPSSHDAAARLSDWRARLPQLAVRMVTTHDLDTTRAAMQSLADDESLLHDHASITWQALGLTTSPSAVLLGADGLLAGGPVGTLTEIEGFVDDVEDVLSEEQPDEVEALSEPH